MGCAGMFLWGSGAAGVPGHGCSGICGDVEQESGGAAGSSSQGGVGPSPFVPRARPGHLRSRESLKRGSAGPGAVKPLPSVPIVSPPHPCPGDARLPPGRGALLAKM